MIVSYGAIVSYRGDENRWNRYKSIKCKTWGIVFHLKKNIAVSIKSEQSKMEQRKWKKNRLNRWKIGKTTVSTPLRRAVAVATARRVSGASRNAARLAKVAHRRRRPVAPPRRLPRAPASAAKTSKESTVFFCFENIFFQMKNPSISSN